MLKVFSALPLFPPVPHSPSLCYPLPLHNFLAPTDVHSSLYYPHTSYLKILIFALCTFSFPDVFKKVVWRDLLPAPSLPFTFSQAFSIIFNISPKYPILTAPGHAFC